MLVDLGVTLGTLRLKNPVLVAAGTFGYGLEFRRSVRLEELGGIVTKTITRKPRHGNLPPRLVETPAGMLNSVGLQNVGLETFLKEKLPRLAALEVPVLVSVLGESVEDVRVMCARLDAKPGVAAIELNLSCPNIKWGQGAGDEGRGHGQSPPPLAPCPLPLQVAQDPDATLEIVSAARQTTTKPLIAKLSPDVTDLRPVAQAAERAGADALAVGNTFTGMSLDPRTGGSRLGSLTGGLSGPAIRPLAVYRVWVAAQAVRCPVIGIGGIVRAEDAVEFFLAGATAVAVGTANFSHPAAGLRVVKGLRRYLERRRSASIHELIGSLKTPHSP